LTCKSALSSILTVSSKRCRRRCASPWRWSKFRCLWLSQHEG